MRKGICLFCIMLCFVMFSSVASADSTGAENNVLQFSTAPYSGVKNSTELFNSYVATILYPAEIEAAGITAGQQLTGSAAVIYQQLRADIEAVAAGEAESTQFNVPIDTLGLPKTYWSSAD